jgi:hypothetical protein
VGKHGYDLLCLLTKLKVLSVEKFIEAQIDLRHMAGEFDDIDTSTCWVAVSHDPREPFESFDKKDMPAQQIALI